MTSFVAVKVLKFSLAYFSSRPFDAVNNIFNDFIITSPRFTSIWRAATVSSYCRSFRTHSFCFTLFRLRELGSYDDQTEVDHKECADLETRSLSVGILNIVKQLMFKEVNVYVLTLDNSAALRYKYVPSIIIIRGRWMTCMARELINKRIKWNL